MKRIWKSVFYIAAVGFLAQPALSDDSSEGFSNDVEILLSLQDSAAYGSRDSVEMQKRILAQINARYVAGKASIEVTPANVSAITSYILSGGNPELGEQFVTSRDVEAGSRALMEGAVLFMRGSKADAAKKLQLTKLGGLPPGLAGRVALAQAMLLPDDEASKIEHFNFAIAAMPGTLVEESAIRRTAAAAAATGRIPLLWKSAERYFHRFPSSLYAVEFTRSLLMDIVTQDKQGRIKDLAAMEQVFNILGSASRRSVYLQLAQSATARGSGGLAQYAARRALRLAVEGSFEALTAELYVALYDLTDTGYEQAIARLQRIDGSRLGTRDRMLLRAALAIGLQIRGNGEATAEMLQGMGDADDVDSKFAALNARTISAIRSADELLKDGPN